MKNRSVLSEPADLFSAFHSGIPRIEKYDPVCDHIPLRSFFVPYCQNGERINFYQTWGDSRRSLRSALVTSTQPEYDLIYTSEDNGDCGRLRCSLVTASYDLAYGALKRRVPVSMRLEHL